MAVVSLLGTQTLNTTSGTHTVVATPAVGDLIVIIRANTGNTASTAPTDTNAGGFGSYSKITSALKATSADLMEVWIRDRLITSATSTTFSDAAGTTTGGGLAVFKITGMSRSGTQAARQSAAQANQAAGGTPTPVFGVATLTANAVIGAVFNATSPATMTPRGAPAYTEAFDVGYSTPTTGLEAMFVSSGETGTSIAWGGTSASAFCSVAVELDTSSLPLFQTLQDNFTSGSFDTTKWSTLSKFGNSPTYASGQMSMATTANSATYSGFDSLYFYDLTGSFAQVQLIASGNMALAGYENYPLQLVKDSSNSLRWRLNNGSIMARTVIGGATVDHNSTAYNSTTHAYLRIRESGGTTFWDYSSDNSTWTNLYSVANPFAVTVLTQEFSVGDFNATEASTTATFDNFNIIATLYIQSLTAAMTPSGAFSKQTQRSLTAAMLSTGALAKKAIRSFTASMLSTGVLNKNIRRALSGSLGISGALTASHLFFKSLTGALGLSGVLTRQTGKPLTGSLPLSGVLNKKTFHSFTASLTPSGVLTSLKAFTRSLTASMTPSGVLSRRTNKPLSGSLGLSGVLSRAAALKRSLTASMTPSGVLNKRTFRSLTGSMTPHGVVTSLKLFVRSFTASMTPSGTLAKQTRRSFTASMNLVGILTSFIPPIFTPIKTIISSFSNKTTDDGSTNIANAGGGVTISDDNSPTNQSSANSEPNDTVISSGPNQETLEG